MTWHDPMGRQVIRSSPKLISHMERWRRLSVSSLLLRALPPLEKPGGQETHRVSNNCNKHCKFQEKSVKFLPATLITCPCIQLRWAVRHFTSIGGRECTSPLFMLVSGNTMHLLSWHVPIWWEVILSSPFVFSWLVAFFAALRTKTVEEVDVGYLNP